MGKAYELTVEAGEVFTGPRFEERCMNRIVREKFLAKEKRRPL
jgi:hypothetical protein